MALIGSGSPLLYVEGSAVQTGGSGNSRTIKITAKFKVNGSSQSWYGYPCNWRASVNNSYGGYVAIKGNESWNGGQSLRTFEQTLTVDVGTTSATDIMVGIYTNHKDYTSWNGDYLWKFRVSATNVPPVISGKVLTSLTGIIPENTNNIKITSPAASDSNLSGYRAQVSINGGGWNQIYSGTSREYTHNISGYGQGTTFRYRFDAYDTAGAYSVDWVYSDTVTKNTFTGDSISSNSSISYSDTNDFISFTYSGANNTNGNTKITRVLSCDGITVYNPILVNTTETVIIYREGNIPEGECYIKFDDIKNKFKDESYKGILNFTLTTSNDYGTVKTSFKSISVNLQTIPNGVLDCAIATDGDSTAYVAVESSNNKYFLPDGTNSRVVRINWDDGSGKLGEEIFYEVYVAYKPVSSNVWANWIKLETLKAPIKYYNHIISKQILEQNFKYKIRTVTSYGTHSDRDTSAQTLQFYNSPSLTLGTITRGGTTCDVQVTIKSNSSIPSINTVGAWKCYNKGTTTVICSGNLTISQNVQILSLSNLIDSGQYDLKVTYKDNTGFSSNITEVVSIGANSPLLFVNKYGVGVGGAKADLTNGFIVKGKIKSDGIEAFTNIEANVNLNNLKTAGEYTQNSNANTSLELNYPEAQAGHLTVTLGAGVQQRYHIYNTSRIYTRAQYSNGSWTTWAKEYNTQNKPSTSDLGAVAVGDVAESSTANKIVKRNSSGDIICRLVKSDYENQPTVDGAMAFRINNSNDNYIRFCSDISSIRNWLQVDKKVRHSISTQHGTQSWAESGFRDSLIQIGDGYGLLNIWLTLSSQSNGFVHRKVNVPSSFSGMIESALGGGQVSVVPGSTWGYCTCWYNNTEKTIEIRGADFAANMTEAAYAMVMIPVKLKSSLVYSIKDYDNSIKDYYYIKVINSKGGIGTSEEKTNISISKEAFDVYYECNRLNQMVINIDEIKENQKINITLENFDKYIIKEKLPAINQQLSEVDELKNEIEKIKILLNDKLI